MNRETYEQLLIAEKDKWEMVTGELIELGKCQFCGHKSRNGYAIKNNDDRTLLVGTDCVFVLCNLPKHQQRAIKHLEGLRKNTAKHASLISEIKAKHKFISIAQHRNWQNKEGEWQMSEYRITKEMREAAECLLCPIHPHHETILNCPTCLGAAIIYKATKTTKINQFWIDKYKECEIKCPA